MRWHETSKRIFAVLLKQGGPKTWRFLHETLEAPAQSTVRALFRKDKVHYEAGVSDGVFEAVGRVYERMKAAAGIAEPVVYELQADARRPCPARRSPPRNRERDRHTAAA